MNPKKKKRGAGLLAVLTPVLLSVLLLTPLAASAADIDGAPATTEAVTAATVTPPAEDSGSEEVTTLGAAVSDFLRDNSAGILSGATFLLTLALSLLCRKRIVPSLLEALGSILGKSREAVGAITEGHEAERAELATVLERAEALLAEARSAAATAEEAAAAIRAGKAGEESLRCILAEQESLLYELLMSANLPQYQKDRIGAAHAAMNAALAGESHD